MFNASYLSDAEFALLDLSYSGQNKVFKGYIGTSPVNEVKVPESVTYIDTAATFGDTLAKKYSFPASVSTFTALSKGVDSKDLAEIEVAPNNEDYSSYYGALYDKEGTTLYFAPASISSDFKFYANTREIYQFAFAYTKLENITLSSTIRALGDYAFAYSNLKQININNVATLGNEVFKESNYEGLFQLSDNHASYVQLLNEDGQFIGYSLTKFNDQDATEYTILKDTISISALAFKGNKKLAVIHFNDELKTICEQAFYGCTGIKSIVIPETVTQIGESIFENCTSLEEATIPNVTYVSTDGLVGKNAVPYRIFYGCTSLKKVSLEEGVESIYQYAFRGCVSLETLELPSTITTIGSYALRSSGIKSLTLPEGLKTIGEQAFYECNSLEGLDFSHTQVSEFGINFIRNCNNLK